MVKIADISSLATCPKCLKVHNRDLTLLSNNYGMVGYYTCSHCGHQYHVDHNGNKFTENSFYCLRRTNTFFVFAEKYWHPESQRMFENVFVTEDGNAIEPLYDAVWENPKCLKHFPNAKKTVEKIKRLIENNNNSFIQERTTL